MLILLKQQKALIVLSSFLQIQDLIHIIFANIHNILISECGAKSNCSFPVIWLAWQNIFHVLILDKKAIYCCNPNYLTSGNDAAQKETCIQEKLLFIFQGKIHCSLNVHHALGLYFILVTNVSFFYTSKLILSANSLLTFWAGSLITSLIFLFFLFTRNFQEMFFTS